MPGAPDRLLAEQLDYYRARSGEYEDWWLRHGRYDHGPEANRQWFAEIDEVASHLALVAPAGEVLELACGTGLWTARLASTANHVTALDGSPEVLEIARSKVPAANVSFAEADLWSWEPDRKYDVCFFSFWLSHVPRERWSAFWQKVGRALVPGGQAYLIDSARSDRASARDHAVQEPGNEMMLRRLADGREFHVVKHWFKADELGHDLRDTGWASDLRATPEFFVYGTAQPSN